MKPLAFPEQTTVLAKDQAPYLPLPVFQTERETITLWGLDWVERLIVLLTGRLWLRQLNFQQPLQPQLPEVRKPILPMTPEEVAAYKALRIPNFCVPDQALLLAVMEYLDAIRSDRLIHSTINRATLHNAERHLNAVIMELTT